MLNGLEWIVLTVAVLGVFVVGTLVLLWRPRLLQAIRGPSIAATASHSNSTAPRIVAITGGLSGEESPSRGRI